MLVDKQSELMSDLLFTVHQHGSDDVTWKPPIAVTLYAVLLLIYFLFNMTGKDKATGKLKKENAHHTY